MAKMSEMMKAQGAVETVSVKQPEVVPMPEELVKDQPHDEPWMRRIESAKVDMTSPRDMFSNDKVWMWDVPPHIKQYIRLNWISDWIIQNKPLMPGFIYDNWKPVTPEVMEDFQIKVFTDTRTPEGVPKVGLDAVLYWCPEDYAKEMDEFGRRGARVIENLKTEKRRMKEKFAGMMIGDVRTGTQEEMVEMEAEQRKELGSPLTKST